MKMSTQIRRCGITSCKNFHNPDTKGSDVYFFKIPSLTTEYGKNWLIALKKVAKKFSGSFICSLHFNPAHIEFFDTSTKGLKYVKLKRGAVPVKCGSELPAKYTVHSIKVKDMIRVVDVEAIKKGSVIQNDNHNVLLTPLAPIILQPRLSTQSSSTKTLCDKRDNLNVESTIESNQTQIPPNSCVQCKVYKDKLDLVEKRCQELEEFIRKNFKETVSDKDESRLGASAEVFPNSHLNGQEETLSDNDDASYWNDNDIDCISNEVLSDNAGNDVETMDEIQPKKSKTVEPMRTNQINENKSVSEVPETVIMNNYYKCDMCNGSTTFNSTSELKNHRKECREDAHASCDSKIGQNKRRLEPTRVSCVTPSVEPPKKIAKTTAIDSPFQCGICVKKVLFKTAREHQKHMIGQHEKALQFECYICKMNLKGLRAAKKHIRLHVRARSEKCEVCDETFTPKEFSRHICDGEKSILCEYCTESFDAMFILIRHIDTEHAKEKILYQCGKCKRFYGMASIKDLHEMHHKEVPKNYICEICSKGFKEKKNYALHRQRHSNTKSFLCATCGRGFSAAHKLEQHSDIHREKTIKCPDCPATFNTRFLFYSHRQTHNPVKVKCDLCSKVLSSRRSYQSHIRYVHNPKEGDKKHACPYCPYKFRKKDKLQTHLRSHTGEKPFVCEYCPDRKFSYKGDLTKHLQTHLGKNIYKCNSCEKAFRLFEELRQHSFEHYKEERDQK